MFVCGSLLQFSMSLKEACHGRDNGNLHQYILGGPLKTIEKIAPAHPQSLVLLSVPSSYPF
jgi:hypothetical protein